MSIRSTVLGWLIPSKWVAYLNGKKRLLGGIALFLYLLIYVLPVIRPEWTFLAALGMKIQQILTASGLHIDAELLATGTGLTVIGLIDWIAEHFFSRILGGILETIEEKLRSISK